uniref:Sodium/potassium-transporting ATPase subunit beta-2 (Trinotate prediction) n=1 Tax=Henneguya salminicola TaxID=69463 RepID=A0A6G3MJX5_HENSL
MKLPNLKNIKYSTLRYFRNLGDLFYNKKERTIFKRPPRQFLFACIFYTVYYGALFGLCAIVYLFLYFLVFGNSPIPHSPNTDLLVKNIALFPLTNNYVLKSFNKADSNTYNYEIQEIQQALNEYDTVDSNKICSPGGSNNGACKFDVKQLGPCATSPYGFDTGIPCLYFRLGKVGKFIDQTRL